MKIVKKKRPQFQYHTKNRKDINVVISASLMKIVVIGHNFLFFYLKKSRIERLFTFLLIMIIFFHNFQNDNFQIGYSSINYSLFCLKSHKCHNLDGSCSVLFELSCMRLIMIVFITEMWRFNLNCISSSKSKQV